MCCSLNLYKKYIYICGIFYDIFIKCIQAAGTSASFLQHGGGRSQHVTPPLRLSPSPSALTPYSRDASTTIWRWGGWVWRRTEKGERMVSRGQPLPLPHLYLSLAAPLLLVCAGLIPAPHSDLSESFLNSPPLPSCQLVRW